MPSPTLPQPRLFTFTVDEPEAIGAECEGHGVPGNRCDVLLSLYLDTAIPLQNTFGEP